MDDHEEAMVAFSQGLATDPKESAMLTALVETMLKSSLRGMCACPCFTFRVQVQTKEVSLENIDFSMLDYHCC